MVLCRLCYLEINGELFKSIFDEKLDPPIWKIVYELVNLTILETDPYTKAVCFDCFDQLLKFHIFRKTVLENDQKFKQNNQQQQHKIPLSKDNFNDNNNNDGPTIKMEIEDEDYNVIDEKVDVEQYQINIDEHFLETKNNDDSRTDIDDKSTVGKIHTTNTGDRSMDDNTISDKSEPECFNNGSHLSHIKEYTSDSESEIILTQPGHVAISTNNNNNINLIPEKSKKIYEKIYMQFIDWTNINNIKSYTEDVLISYFDELSIKMKSSSLWKAYSILKSTLNIKHKIDIAQYSNLYARLKRESEGYKRKQSKTFTPNEIRTFILEAPDNLYLMIKVALIFGIMGACRRHELYKLKFTDVNITKSTILVIIQGTRSTKTIRKFIVNGIYYNLCRKYMDLRPENCTNSSFFLNYIKGKCTCQNVGLNKFGKMGKQIATYLKLPDPHLYTGHCFRRSSTAISIDAVGGDLTTLKRVVIESVPPKL